MSDSENVATDGMTVNVGTGVLGAEGLRVFLSIKREWIGAVGGYLKSEEARALAALLVKHADRAEGK